MTTSRGEISALIEANSEARDQYNATRRALEKAVWEAREKLNPQPGEAWHILLPYDTFVRTKIPAIKTVTAWITDPGYLGEADPEDGYIPESAAIPLDRLAEASPLPGETE